MLSGFPIEDEVMIRCVHREKGEEKTQIRFCEKCGTENATVMPLYIA
jgi:hypothetical protein